MQDKVHEDGTAVWSERGLSGWSCEGASGAGGDGEDDGMRREPRGVTSSRMSGGSENMGVAHTGSPSRRSDVLPACAAPAWMDAASEVLLKAAGDCPFSPLSCKRLSSMTASTLRSFDSDLRWEWDGREGVYGTECRLLTAGGDAEGETEVDVAGDIEGDVGDVETFARAALVSGKKLPALVHEFFPSLLLSISGVEVMGLGLADDVLAITDKGGKIVNILSSAGGGPYESNGSGTA
jgi:hypothetical protein